ncbi:MAG: antibiotic biosynthesis monooxygenase [Acidovorax sp.]|nr:antibiotic biosynthesis monooxygenase [Acidovorax sp.]
MSMLIVIAVVKAKPEKVGSLRPVLRALLAPTLAEEGCVRYEMNEIEGGGVWVFTEQWESKALWEQHMSSKHLEGFKAVADEMVASFELYTGALIRQPG